MSLPLVCPHCGHAPITPRTVRWTGAIARCPECKWILPVVPDEEP